MIRYYLWGCLFLLLYYKKLFISNNIKKYKSVYFSSIQRLKTLIRWVKACLTTLRLTVIYFSTSSSNTINWTQGTQVRLFILYIKCIPCRLCVHYTFHWSRKNWELNNASQYDSPDDTINCCKCSNIHCAKGCHDLCTADVPADVC